MRSRQNPPKVAKTGRLWAVGGVWIGLREKTPLGPIICRKNRTFEGKTALSGQMGISHVGSRLVCDHAPEDAGKGFYLRYYEDKSLSFHCANADSTPLAAQFSALTTNGNEGLPVGRHTLVVCVGREISGGRPSYLAWYLDGLALSQAITQQTMTAADITQYQTLFPQTFDFFIKPSDAIQYIHGTMFAQKNAALQMAAFSANPKPYVYPRAQCRRRQAR